MVVARGNFQRFLEDFQQLAEGLWVDCPKEGFVQQSLFGLITRQDSDE